MANIKIARDSIDTILETAGNNFLSVEFKKVDGSLRKLQGHLKVKKYLKGGESTIKDREDLVSIFDMTAKEYRCFSKNRLIKMRVNGNTYTFND